MKLKDTNWKELVKARAKKLLLDITSLKGLTIIYLAVAVWFGKVAAVVGVPALLMAVGIREMADFKDKQSSAGGEG